jgi:hypothetical protein
MSRVPDVLMQHLHDANLAFAEARSKFKDLEQMDAKQRSDAAQSLRSAEQAVEELENQITAFLRAQDHSVSA